MLKNLKIGKKLILAFLVIALLGSVTGIVSSVVIRNMDTQYSDALTNYGFSQGDIGKAMLMLADINRCTRDIVGFTNQADIDAAKAQMQESMAQYQQYVDAVQTTLVGAEEQAMFDTINAAREKFLNKKNEIIAIGDTTDPEQSRLAQEMLVDQLDPIYNELYDSWDALMTMNVDTGYALSDKLTKQGSSSLLFTIVLIMASIVVSVVLGVFIARVISRPIEKCVERLSLLEQGDLTTPVPPATSNDETGTLLNALKNTVDGLSAMIKDTGWLMGEMANGNFDVSSKAADSYVGEFEALKIAMDKLKIDLNSTLLQIDQSADQVAGGAEQVSSSAQALSQGATEQASSVEELAATITEISDQVRDNAESARQASQKADNVGAEAAESNLRMQQMLDAMAEIDGSANEIGKIIKTIEDIAFQTNILALNAAVEAARAGSAGKGIADLADEVRNLANKSQEASQNTASLIEGALQAVQNGTRIADDTAQSLVSVVQGVGEVTTTINQIAQATDAQADAISQVTMGIDQISSVVQTNSATAEESAAASEELSGQSMMLKDLVSQFTLDRTIG